MSRLMIGLALCAIYAAIFVKTNRLARVFKPTTPLRPRCISPPAQVALCAGIVITQLIGSLVWLVVDPPDTAIQYPTRTEAVLTCKATASHLLLSLSFNMLLVLLCTFYAFKTRQIPENFNETRLIGFTMYSTSILWLSFGPIYFATQNSFHIQITSLCICISMSATVALSCFFFPKVYICLYAPYKNVRNRNSAVGKLVNQQMRFISQMTTPNEIPSHPPTRMGLELSTNCTTSASAMDGSTTHAASFVYPRRAATKPSMESRAPRPSRRGSTKPHSPPRAATVQLSSQNDDFDYCSSLYSSQSADRARRPSPRESSGACCCLGR
ncbi:Metabotropic glutamate receptor [Aphelenchoides fujianensis]|nr:Metabotropic glutamate receptor [Aphelenchoides fujianensis]